MTDSQLRDDAVIQLKKTTSSYAVWAKNVKTGKYNPQDGSQTAWGKALDLLAQIGLAPPPTGSAGIGLDQLGGSLSGCAHLTDRTYQAVVGSWDELPLLAQTTAAGTLGFAYQDAPAWVNDPAGFVTFVKSAHDQQGFSGVFMDEVDPVTPGMLSFIRAIGPPLKAAGILTIANCSHFISGDPGSNDGSVWRQWASQVGQSVSHVMLEYWQQFGHSPVETQLRTIAEFWAGWQLCVAAVRPAAFIALSYGNDANLIYGRASMLKAPGIFPGDIFMGHRWPDHADPYSPAWCKKDPSPTVNPTNGTATL